MEAMVTDEQWARITPLLPPVETRGTYYRDHRVILNGMLFRLHTGCPRRDLPEHYGPRAHGRLAAAALDTRGALGSHPRSTAPGLGRGGPDRLGALVHRRHVRPGAPRRRERGENYAGAPPAGRDRRPR